MADNELGSYLRQRREAVSPEQVGLPRGGRRRTPGLRRAEVATLAGVSIDYLTRLEQGRDRNRRARAVYPAWEVVAAAAAAEIGADNRPDDPAFDAFLESLGEQAGADLRDRLAGVPTVARRTAVVRMLHPEAGELRLAYESMQVPDVDQRLVVHLPHDEATGRALDELVLPHPGGLHAVSG